MAPFFTSLHKIYTIYGYFYHIFTLNLSCINLFIMEDTVLIEVKNLVKYYGTKPAVDNISFKLESGKVYGFLGPNGAGKSTTMNIMTGYLAATSGDVIINDFDILGDPEEAKKNIGYLPELPPLYMDMTVQEYLSFVAGLKKMPKKDRKPGIDSVIEMTGLGEYRNRLISNLSKGYKQRVGLAQAILGNPEIIILDEPTVGLDPRQIIEIRDLIKRLSVDHTIILSSHILSEINAVCDEILIIVRGHLIAYDTPKALVERFSNDLKLEMKIKGNIEEIRGALAGIDGIGELSVSADFTDRSVCNVIITETGVDIREKIFNALSAAALPIYEMKRNEPSLEDVFLKLSAEEEARYAAAMEQEELEKMEKRNKTKQTAEADDNEAEADNTEGEEKQDDSDI